MKRSMWAITTLFAIISLNHCTCKQRITEKELDTIAKIKRSPELAAYKDAFKKRDTCLQYEMGEQAFNDMGRVHHILADTLLTRQQREEAVKRFHFKVNPCFWERQAKRQKLFSDLCSKYPEVLKLSPMAFHNLVNVN